MKNEKYQFFGALILYSKYPDEIYPIFHKDNNLFMQKCSDNSTAIESFELIDEKYYPLIQIINDEKLIKGNLLDEYDVGSDYVIGLQLDKDCYFLGNNESLLNYLENGQIVIQDNEILDDLKQLSKKKDNK